jgi:hypothetical protein
MTSTDLRAGPAPDMPAPTPHVPLPGRIRWHLKDCWTVTKRNLRHFARKPRLVVFSTIQPVMFVILFSSVFGGVAETALPEGIDFEFDRPPAP